MDTKILEQIGLTKSEIKVYLALLGFGTSTVGPLLEKSKVANSKIYFLLNKLIEKGLVSLTEKQGTKCYNAESPNRMLDYIDLKKQELEKEKQELKQLLPSILSKQKIPKENTVKVFEGRRGIFSAYEDIIETLPRQGEILYFSLGEEDLTQIWVQNFFKEFAQKRKEKGIFSKGIYPRYMKKTISKNFKGQPLHKIKFSNYIFPTGVIIYNSKVLLLDWKNLIVFMICSDQIAENYRRVFEELWKNTKSN